MNIDWQPLREELALWRRSGLELPFWWRDDDAIEPTPELDELTALAGETGVPVHLAVIPRDATQTLASQVKATQMLIPVVHGWAHENHAPPSLKKAEFGATREMAECVSDIAQALEKAKSLFGDRLALMFVPPWNRIDLALMTPLAEAGFSAISSFQSRREPDTAPGLAQINTHLDPIFWRGTRGLVEPAQLVALAVALLKDRRRAITDNSEPFGYLTHHLVHDADIWEFSRQFLQEMSEGPIRLYRHDRKEEA
ncbi:polysaccharide deacetylase family protein [uncultured Shimia sp.]|uniref:polysaccharide deacetylase family protein n=1 Tax=uncultured Shimia sp. TaxID=573152 RepID=UPI002635B7EA|nr:polysaccharide deacetylase family protein [uncultured Shimia sp.]